MLTGTKYLIRNCEKLLPLDKIARYVASLRKLSLALIINCVKLELFFIGRNTIEEYSEQVSSVNRKVNAYNWL